MTKPDFAIDFTAIFLSCSGSSQLSALFRKMTGQLDVLGEIVRNVEVSVGTAHPDLPQMDREFKTLKATISNNSSGDYFAVLGTWSLTLQFLKNLGNEFSRHGLRFERTFQAVRETLSVLHMEIVHVNIQTQLRIDEIVAGAFPTLSSASPEGSV